MSSILGDKYIFYSYWDSDGHGINPEHLTTYSSSVIFDHYNRTLYAYGGVFGPHDTGSYHGEIFNDYKENSAKGDYSSAHGHAIVSYNNGEAGFGEYNVSRTGKTIFTVGNGTSAAHHNAFELWKDGSSYFPGTVYTARISSYESRISDNAYAGKNLWVKHIDDASYTNASYAFSRMVSVFPLSGETYNGKYYIWVGKTIDLPPVEERYANVIYIACDEMPSSSLPIFNDDTN